MKIDYQETTNDLLTRIDIHNKYGGRDIDAWMLEVLALAPGMNILDVACGGGKQCVSFYKDLEGNCTITGGDVNEELLRQARLENEKLGKPFTIMPLNFDERFPFDDNTFDLVSCCFAIYYSSDIPFTIREMHRVLKPGGRMFPTGPMPDNKKVFYDIIRKATGREIPPMPGSSRYGSEILNAIKNTFAHTEVKIFENPLTFKQSAPFLAYTRASLSEDRKLWTSLFDSHESFESTMQSIHRVADEHIREHGELVMTKVVGGFIGTK